MVQDSLVEQFAGQDVVVAGIELWNSSDSLIDAYIAQTGATFTICESGWQVGNTTYDVLPNSIVVIDQGGVIRFVQELGTSSVSYSTMRAMVSDAAATVAGLLAAGVVGGRPLTHAMAQRAPTAMAVSVGHGGLPGHAAPAEAFTVLGRLLTGSSSPACQADGARVLRPLASE